LIILGFSEIPIHFPFLLGQSVKYNQNVGPKAAQKLTFEFPLIWYHSKNNKIDTVAYRQSKYDNKDISKWRILQWNIPL